MYSCKSPPRKWSISVEHKHDMSKIQVVFISWRLDNFDLSHFNFAHTAKSAWEDFKYFETSWQFFYHMQIFLDNVGRSFKSPLLRQVDKLKFWQETLNPTFIIIHIVNREHIFEGKCCLECKWLDIKWDMVTKKESETYIIVDLQTKTGVQSIVFMSSNLGCQAVICHIKESLLCECA